MKPVSKQWWVYFLIDPFIWTTKAEIFGERALLGGDKRAATIKVVSETAKTLSMDKMLGGAPTYLNRKGFTAEPLRRSFHGTLKGTLEIQIGPP